jgi:hypothetical protein
LPPLLVFLFFGGKNGTEKYHLGLDGDIHTQQRWPPPAACASWIHTLSPRVTPCHPMRPQWGHPHPTALATPPPAACFLTCASHGSTPLHVHGRRGGAFQAALAAVASRLPRAPPGRAVAVLRSVLLEGLPLSFVDVRRGEDGGGGGGGCLCVCVRAGGGGGGRGFLCSRRTLPARMAKAWGHGRPRCGALLGPWCGRHGSSCGGGCENPPPPPLHLSSSPTCRTPPPLHTLTGAGRRRGGRPRRARGPLAGCGSPPPLPPLTSNRPHLYFTFIFLNLLPYFITPPFLPPPPPPLHLSLLPHMPHPSTPPHPHRCWAPRRRPPPARPRTAGWLRRACSGAPRRPASCPGWWGCWRWRRMRRRGGGAGRSRRSSSGPRRGGCLGPHGGPV